MYLAKSDTGSGNVWFKIYEDGYSGGKWGVDRMLDKRGRVDIKIPSGIPFKYYCFIFLLIYF